LARSRTEVLRIPVSKGGAWTVTDAAGKAVPSQLTTIDSRTKELPLLYLNKFNMNASQIAKEEAKLSNKADQILSFEATLPAVGYAAYGFKQSATAATDAGHAAIAVERPAAAASTGAGNADTTVENEAYKLTFSGATGLLSTVEQKLNNNLVTDLSIEWGWYNSSVGGTTLYSDKVPRALQEPGQSDQASGAYMFRPNTSELFFPGPHAIPTVQVVEGPLVTEVYQRFSAWATHVVRLYHSAPGAAINKLIEVEWTAGPIPVETPWFPPVAHAHNKPLPNEWGKEVVMRFNSSLGSKGTFYTDSNGKEMVKRQYNKRGPSYPSPYKISEEVAGNYYPVNAMMTLDDGATELAILTDVSMGGASLADGSLELMVHRRVLMDDRRGVQEPLNETMCGCNDINADPGKMGAHGHLGDGGCECAGLTMRGRHWLILDTVANSHDSRRIASEALNLQPTLAVSPTGAVAPVTTFLAAEMPEGVQLQALTSNYASFNNGSLLLRLTHLYGAGESAARSVPITVSLAAVFGKAGLTIASVVETSLTGNQGIEEMDKKKFPWPTRAPNAGVEAQLQECGQKFEHRVPFNSSSAALAVTMRPAEVRTFLAKFA
jgi:alpha-mannosidase